MKTFLKVELKYPNPMKHGCFRVDEPTTEHMLEVSCQSRRSCHTSGNDIFDHKMTEHGKPNHNVYCTEESGEWSIKQSFDIPWSWVIDWRSHMVREKCKGNMEHFQLEGIPSVVFKEKSLQLYRIPGMKPRFIPLGCPWSENLTYYKTQSCVSTGITLQEENSIPQIKSNMV